uniref:Uncharacterized protein n=1 Tax=Arundo donax TaxID=35708 RepID=A0A0A9E211_ARUDO
MCRMSPKPSTVVDARFAWHSWSLMFHVAELSEARTCRRGARGNATPAVATGTIEAACVPLPHYASKEFAAIPDDTAAPSTMKNGGDGHQHEERKGGMAIVKSCSKAGHEKCNGIPWTKEKHGLFLLGLDKFNKDWWTSHGHRRRWRNFRNLRH